MLLLFKRWISLVPWIMIFLVDIDSPPFQKSLPEKVGCELKSHLEVPSRRFSFTTGCFHPKLHGNFRGIACSTFYTNYLRMTDKYKHKRKHKINRMGNGLNRSKPEMGIVKTQEKFFLVLVLILRLCLSYKCKLGAVG